MKELELLKLEGWYGKLEEIVEDIENQGYVVNESNEERIEAMNDDLYIEIELNTIYVNDKPSTISITDIKYFLDEED